MSTSVLVVAIALYVIGAFLIGLPLALKSINVWRTGTKYRRFEGQDVNYTGGVWGFILFPKTAMTECVGRRASAPLGMRLIGLGTPRRYRAYVITTMLVWLPRLLFNALSFSWWMLVGAVLMLLDNDR